MLRKTRVTSDVQANTGMAHTEPWHEYGFQCDDNHHTAVVLLASISRRVFRLHVRNRSFAYAPLNHRPMYACVLRMKQENIAGVVASPVGRSREDSLHSFTHFIAKSRLHVIRRFYRTSGHFQYIPLSIESDRRELIMCETFA